MTAYYAYTPEIWPSFLVVILLLALAVYSGHRRSVPGALPFTIACLFAALWAAGSMMEYAALDLATKITWVKFQAAWQVPTVTAVTCFTLEYTWPGRWLTRRNLALLSIPPLLILILILMEKWLINLDQDIRWIMEENLKKGRLVRIDAEWVEKWRGI